VNIKALIMFGLLSGGLGSLGCNSSLKVKTTAVSANPGEEEEDFQNPTDADGLDPEDGGRNSLPPGDEFRAAKLADPNCVDPDLADIPTGVQLTLCDGLLAEGTLVLPPSCVADGDSDCVVSGASLKAANLANFAATDIRSGVAIAGITGSLIGSPAVCANDGEGNCLVDGSTFKAAKLSNFSGADVKSGVTIAGVGGSATLEGHSDCAADGGTGCVATATYTAALTTGLAAKVVSGNTVAGVPGSATAESHSNCAADGEAGCVVVGPAFKAADTSVAVAGNIKSGVTIGGALGTFGPACNADGGVSCLVDGTSYKAAKLSNFTGADVKSGVTIAGVGGSATLEGHSDCAADGGTGCVATATYTAALTTGLGDKVLSGQTVAGVAGNVTLPAVGDVESGVNYGVAGTGSSGTFAVPAQANVASGTNYGAGGTEFSGSATIESHSNCAADGGTGCVATATYTAALTTGLAAKVVSGNTVAGVAGSATAESHSSCAADGEAGCVVVGPAFKAADTSIAVAGNIKSGVTLAGTLGTYGAACNADGGGSCLVDGTNYKAAKLSNFTAADVKSGVTIAGVGGSATLEGHSDCAADGGTGCVATGTYTAALTTGLANKVLSGQTVAGISGNVTLPAVGDVESGVNYGVAGTGSSGTFAVPAQANVASGTNYGAGGTEFSGSATIESHSNCAADGGTGCVATATYTAALTTGLGDKVLSGQTVAGVSGNVTLPAVGDVESGVNYGVGGTGSSGTFAVPALANVASGVNYGAGGTEFTGSATIESHSACTAANQSGCVATTTYKTMNLTGAGTDTGLTAANFNATIKAAGNFEFWDAAGAKHSVTGDTDLASANIANLVNIFGTTGNATLESHSSCTADNQTGCITTATYKSADTAAIATSDLKSGKTIAGIAGALANCASDGEAGCVVVGPAFKAADMSVATVGNIKSGVTIAGVIGQFPSATYTLSGASGTTDLTSMAATTAAGSYEFWDSAGSRYTGSIADASTITPGTSDQTFNASLYRQFTVSGDADLVVGNIKSGVGLFGVTGQYPSATYPLPSASGTADLDAATFNAKVKSSTAFEYWSSDGSYQTGAGDDDIVAANIVSGISIFGTSGSAVVGSDCTGDGQTGCVTTSTYKSADTSTYSTWDIRKGKTVGGKAGDLVFYKNMIGSYNNSTAPAVAGNDVWDTVDDYNNNGAFPTTAPSGWDQATGANWVMDSANDTGVGSGTASDGLCNGTEACVFKDQITSLMWAKDQASTFTWQNAITQCDNLNYGGYTDWRLPTQKELMQAYTDGVWSQKAATKLNLSSSYYWSSSTVSTNTTFAWVVRPSDGFTDANDKTLTYRVVCVR